MHAEKTEFDALSLGFGPVNLAAIYVDNKAMTKFDQEMKIFKEIIPKYKPVKGYFLVLDLADYKKGIETIRKFEIGSEEYHQYINIECYEKKIEVVIICSNIEHCISYHSHNLNSEYSYEKKEFVEIEDRSPKRKILNRNMAQEMALLYYELNNPQIIKPDC